MVVLVVGGAGYIGSHTARVLRQHGFDVLIYDNLSTGRRFLAKDFELIVGDIGDSSALQQAITRVDAVMHFAAHAYVGESVENPRKYFRNNVEAGLNLLNLVVDRGIQYFVFSSSCAVYGRPSKVPITEDNVRQPINPYGVSKLFFENALEAYAHAYGLRCGTLRYFNAAGADENGDIGELHDPETHLIPLALAATSGDGPELSVFGDDYTTPDGTCIRDYVHVNDLAEAHVLALQHLTDKASSFALNLGTGEGNSVLDVIKTTEEVTGKAVRRHIVPRRPGDPPALVADPSRANQMLGWKAKRTLKEMVASAWKWKQNASREEQSR
jgi:UDP-arabinose 4-epimerase